MKNLQVLLLAMLLWSCNQSGSKKDESILAKDSGGTASASAGQKTGLAATMVSLNGVPEQDAKNMIIDFKDNYWNKVVPRSKVSVWFSSDVIRKMYTLLDSEGATLSPVVGKPDGFRIYFVHDPSTADPTELSVLLVATTFNGTVPGTAPAVQIHKNYYHKVGLSAASPTATFRGERKIGDCNGGALLHRRCPNGHCPEFNCNIDPQHHITREYGETMVNNFGNNAINTRSVWFDFNLLNNLVKSNILTKMTGIRIYFGNYGEFDANGAQRPNTGDERKDRDSFILMPTKLGKNSAGDAIDIDKFDCDPLKDLLANAYFKLNRTGGYDIGELCPSHCNEDEGQ